ncbi:Gfo/Idh/MocA family protein [Tepidimicrobium xylanilyticum]
MIRYGIVGTSWITEAFIEAANQVGDYKLNAVYSRSENKAIEFAKKYNVGNIFINMEEMAKSNEIDAVYIASPNSFHAEHSKLFLRNKKHVICEKAIASNVEELKSMVAAARENGVLLMEALRTNFLPSISIIKDNLHKLGTIRRYIGNYCQYSSRYDAFKAGELPNIFNPEFSAGSLMDIGVYCIHPLVLLFGLPKDVVANGYILSSGVDGLGSLLLKYDDMEAIIIHSKITNSHLGSEIQGEKGIMIIDKIDHPQKIKIIYNDGQTEDLSVELNKHNMYYEAKEFAKLINEGKTESDINSFEQSLHVMSIIEKARRKMGVKFPADYTVKALLE